MIYYDVKICCYYIQANTASTWLTLRLDSLITPYNPEKFSDRYEILMLVAEKLGKPDILNALEVQCIVFHHRADRRLQCLLCTLRNMGLNSEPEETIVFQK